MALGPMLTALLKQYGLESLTQWATDMATTGASPEEIEVSLWDQQAFRDRFWMLFQHQQNGFGAISPAEVLAYESSARELASSFGLKVTDQDIGEWIANGKGLPEQQSRMELASKAAYQTDAVTREELQTRYGIGPGDMTSYWLDPKKTLQDVQRRYVQADIAASAIRSGYHPSLDEEDLGTLYDRGFTGDNAGQVFGTLANSAELFKAVDQSEGDIGVKGQIGLITGDTDVAKEVQKRTDKRKAYFQEGGGFASGKTGVSGIGTANT